MEGFTQPEGVTEQEVIDILDSKGIEALESAQVLGRFVDSCMAEADREAAEDPDNPVVSNRANIKVQIKMGVLFSKTKNYKREALYYFEDALMAASQDDSTEDLAKNIEDLIMKVEVATTDFLYHA
jgi:hypothetical protein